MSESSTLLKDARREAGLTQAELARRLGVSQAAIAKLERPGSNPTVRTLDAPKWRSGVDESLIRQQLALAPAERIRQLDRQATEMRTLIEAGEKARGELS